MIDLHSHLLPGVDDGSPSIERSVTVLEWFGEIGVECVVLTPHLEASGIANAPRAAHEEILERLRAAAPQVPELRLGWEIMLDQPSSDLRPPHLGLGGSRAVLVEFPRMAVPSQAADELYRIRCSGVRPVLAHPERYWGCTVERVREWRDAGAVIQMDTAGLLGSGAVTAISRSLLEAGLVDVFSSDNHGDRRSLATARDWLTEVGTPTHVDLLTRGNARRLLDDEPLLPVPPLSLGGGPLKRLRELFLGSSRRNRS